MDNVLTNNFYQRAKLNRDGNPIKFIIGNPQTGKNAKEFIKEAQDMSVANISLRDIVIMNDIKNDCINIQKKIPEIKEVYYKKTLGEIKLYIFIDDSDIYLEGRVFKEIVELKSNYKKYFDFKVFSEDFDKDVIETDMIQII